MAETRTSTDADALSQLVAATRSIGADPSLVLNGGGNSSLKSTYTDISGEAVGVLYMKGSGHDMAVITAAGFAPLRLEQVRRLLPPVVVPTERLLNELRCALLDASAPDPSVETRSMRYCPTRPCCTPTPTPYWH